MHFDSDPMAPPSTTQRKSVVTARLNAMQRQLNARLFLSSGVRSLPGRNEASVPSAEVGDEDVMANGSPNLKRTSNQKPFPEIEKEFQIIFTISDSVNDRCY